MKKILSIFLAIAMLVTTCAVSAARYTDTEGHWAQNEIEAWSDYGVISGYNGEFSPNRYITRGEFAVVLSRLMGYQKESANIFNDLPEKFYTGYVLKLFEAGVMQGYDGYIRPEDSLTREEASVIICRALGINTADTMNRDFADESDISSWAKGYINSMVNTGLLNGADGKLNPKNPIMRSEVVKILDNAVYPILKSGTFDNVNTNKILVVSSGNVTIKNSELNGNVIITQGVTEGKISFQDAKIKSDVIIDNERSAFIETKNTTVTDKNILKHKAFIKDTTGGGSTGGTGGSGSSGGGNSGGSSGGSSGGNTGGDNTGGSTGGDNPGDNTGGNTGSTGETIKVTFNEGYGRYAEVISEVDLTLDANGRARVREEDIPESNFPWNGYEKKDYMPSGYADYRGKHEVQPEFWYKDNGEWKIFNESTILTANTDVYLLFSEVSVNALGTAVTIRYDENSRAMDSAKAFLDKAIPQLSAAKDAGINAYEELTSKILGMIEGTNLVDDDKYVKNIKFALSFTDALTDSGDVTDIISNGYFDVTSGNLELLNSVCEELQNITFDEILESESGNAIDAMVSLVGYDVCEEVFDGIRNEYCTEFADIIADVESGAVDSGRIPSTLTMVFDTIDDIMRPLYEEAQEDVISNFDESVCYDENPYFQYLVEDLDIISELFEKVDDGTDERTGYKLTDFITCFEYAEKMLIATDDALCWYDGNVDYGEICEALYAKTNAVLDRFNSVLNDPQYKDKLPDSIKSAFEGIQQIEEIFLKIKPDFEDALYNYVDVKTDVMLKAIFSDNGGFRAKIQELIDSGELYSKIDEFKNSAMGQNLDEEIIDDLVEIIENIAEFGISHYKVPTTGETVIDKYQAQIGDYTFSISRYFEF